MVYTLLRPQAGKALHKEGSIDEQSGRNTSLAILPGLGGLGES